MGPLQGLPFKRFKIYWSRAGPASRLVIRTSAMAGNFSASMLTPHTYTLRPSGILLTQTVVFWEKNSDFGAVQRNANLVDLENPEKMSIWLLS